MRSDGAEAETEFEALSRRVIGLAIEVHRELGPGLLESAYEQYLAHELMENGVRSAAQVLLPVIYKGMRLDCGYRMDIVIEEKLLVELKSVEMLQKIRETQLFTYVKFSKIEVGRLNNFNNTLLTSGIKRLIL